MQKIFEKIKNRMHEILKKWANSSCYTLMEYEGIAIFGMCGGKVDENGQQSDCEDCPYYVGVRGD